MFMLLCSWAIERERASPRQVAGMLIFARGNRVILSRGDAQRAAAAQLHAGDAWILLAMPVLGHLLGAAASAGPRAWARRRSCS
jgi:drug/metabolite transporter (DMT)-like permease